MERGDERRAGSQFHYDRGLERSADEREAARTAERRRRVRELFLEPQRPSPGADIAHERKRDRAWSATPGRICRRNRDRRNSASGQSQSGQRRGERIAQQSCVITGRTGIKGDDSEQTKLYPGYIDGVPSR